VLRQLFDDAEGTDFARTAFELVELLEPGRTPGLLRDVPADVG
jgi:hypothetical protein